MTDSASGNSPQPQKGHLNQNLVIAIIGAIATVMAAVIPWVLDRTSQATPTAIQATFTSDIPIQFTATDLESTATTETETEVVTASSTPTLESPTATAITPTEEIGIYNAFLARDIEGNFINTSFNNDQSIYLFFDLNDPQNRNIVKVAVSVVNVPGFLKGAVVNLIEDKMVNPNIVLAISKTGLKPGKYKVDMYLNNTLDETIEFEVTE
jgi:hypothetical protein